MSDDADEYEVEAVRGREWNVQFGCYQYFIKWKNYPEEANEWSTPGNMTCDELIKEFHAQCEKAFGKDMRTSKKKIVFDKRGRLIHPASVRKKPKKSTVKRNRIITETDEEIEPPPLANISSVGDVPSMSAGEASPTVATGTTSVWELEEEEEQGFVYDPYCQEFKAVNDGESGFDRNWEVEKIVVLVNAEQPDGSKCKCAIVKFRKYKYAQRIVLSKVLQHAKAELLTFLNEEFLRTAKM